MGTDYDTFFFSFLNLLNSYVVSPSSSNLFLFVSCGTGIKRKKAKAVFNYELMENECKLQHLFLFLSSLDASLYID